MPFFKTPLTVSFDGDGYIREEGTWDADGDTAGQIQFDNSGNFPAGAAKASSVTQWSVSTLLATDTVDVSQQAASPLDSIDLAISAGTATGKYMIRGKAV